jgi:hypothetical protein
MLTRDDAMNSTRETGIVVRRGEVPVSVDGRHSRMLRRPN